MRFIKILLPLSFTIVSMFAFGADRSSEIAEYISVYKGNDLMAQKKKTESLAWMGIMDERVYDQIERLLLELYPNSGSDRLTSDSVSWFIKALGFSGNPKYISTLKRIGDESESKTHVRYVNEALAFLPQYTEWNRTINDESQWNPQESAVVNRYANMIRSDSMRLKELAAKRIYNERISSKYLLEIVNKELLAHYADPKGKSDNNFAITFGYMSKALAANGDGEYYDTVLQVKKKGASKRLRKMAQRQLSQFPKNTPKPIAVIAPKQEDHVTTEMSEVIPKKAGSESKPRETTQAVLQPSKEQLEKESSGQVKDYSVRLQTLKELYDKGLIDSEDYEEKKRSIMKEL